MLAEIIFYLAIGALCMTYFVRKAKREEVVLYDPHADDFNKDIWED